MKYFFIAFVILVNGSLLFAQSSAPTSHKQRMIEDINDGNFEKALEEIIFVDNWNFDKNNKLDYMDIDKALGYSYYIDSVHIDNEVARNFFDYFLKECYAYVNIFYCQKDYKRAIYYMEVSCVRIKKIYGERHHNFIASLYNIGELYIKAGDYSQAEQYYLQALNIEKLVLGEQHPDYAVSLYNIGELYKKTGDYSKAATYYLQALEIDKEVLGEQHPDYAVSLNNLGALYDKMGDDSKAEAYYLQALEIKKAVLGEKHPNYAISLNNLGGFYDKTGDYSQAEQYYSQALEIDKEVLGEQHPDYATLLNNLGLLYIHKGDCFKAEICLQQALEIDKEVLGEQHPDYAVSLNNLGALYDKMGDDSKAEAYYLQALEIKKAVLGEKHPNYAISLNNLGGFYDKTGDYSQAEQYYSQALEIDKEVLGEQHPDYAKSLYNMGILYSKIKDYAKAETYYIQASQLLKNEFLKSLDFMTERQRQLYWDVIQNSYTNAYPALSYRRYIESLSVSTFAYNNELFTKELLLNSSIAIARSIQMCSDTALIHNFDQLKSIKQRILNLQENDPQSPYIAECSERAEQLEKEITKSSAAYRENKAMWQITWDSVRNRLKRKQVAIEYMVVPLNADSTMYCALLLRRNSKYPEMIPLFEEKEIQTLINTSSENQIYNYKAGGRQISALVWGKVLPRIKRGETIYFAPSGLLHQLAIESLPYDNTHTMGDVYNMVRLSSTREIVLNKTADTHTTATLYGGIQYNVDAEELLAESEAYSAKNLLAPRGIEADTLNRGSVNYLAGTKTEVENIHRMLKQNHLQVQLYSATSANEESFKALSGQHQNILHIATHGFFWSDSTAQKKDYFAERMMLSDDKKPAGPIIDPLNRCGLLFAGANLALQGHSNELPEGVQDGILTAKEISLLDLRDADLVVLSACETGKGEITGDGVFGLQRAFKQAGAQTIIMSLWPVNDAATQMLMTEFYKNWITNHQSKRVAFSNAQNAVRGKYSEPAYWAGFVMLD